MFKFTKLYTWQRMILVLLLCATALSAESTEEPVVDNAKVGAEGSVPIPEPQIAYRVLSDYASTQPAIDRQANLLSGVLYSTSGGLGVLSGIALGIWGPELFPELPTSALNVIAVGAIVDFGLLAAIGIGKLVTPPVDYFHTYAFVFTEEDPIVQEALAAATLREMARKGLETRVSQAIVSIVTPILSTVVQMITNSNAGRPIGENLEITFGIGGALIVGGSISLLNKSTEELLYDKYLSAREALYSTPRQASDR